MDRTLLGTGFPLPVLDFDLFPKIKEGQYHFRGPSPPLMKPLPMEVQSVTRGKASAPPVLGLRTPWDQCVCVGGGDLFTVLALLFYFFDMSFSHASKLILFLRGGVS